MAEEEAKAFELVESRANSYIRQESGGSGSPETNIKESLGQSKPKMTDPGEIASAPEPAKPAAPVDTDDRGQDFRIPSSPAPRKYSDYDFYVASVWRQIERDGGLHVPYKEKLRILKAMTGVEEPPAQLPGNIEQLKEKHYSRNSLNDPPKTEEEAIANDWIKLKPWQTVFHSQGENCEANVKYVDPTGHMEVIFDHLGQRVDDPENTETYNYYNPITDPAGHAIYDIIPYLFWGNTPDDPSTISHRIGLMFKANSVRNEQIQKDLGDSLCISFHGLTYDDVFFLGDSEQCLITSGNIHSDLERR